MRPLRVLLVGDEKEDGARLRDFAAESSVLFALEWAGTFEAGLQFMTSGRYDAHLIYSRLGDGSGIDLLRAYRDVGDGSPVIMVGPDDRALDIAAMESGAAGYLVKDRLNAAGFERAVRYAIVSSRRAEDHRRVRDELETRVAERADALETLNEALAAEVAERRLAERALREADRRKDAFFATLAHELRNPLAPLSSAAEMLSRTGDNPEEQERRERALHVVQRQVAHMVRLIDDLLDLSRITHGKLELRRERVTLAAVIESALETAGPLLLRRRHAFELVVPAAPVALHVDGMRLAQLLSNLLSNAAKYTEPGGRIRLEAVRDGHDVVVTVVDSGIGIRAAQLAHVFTMFGQGHRALDPVYGGLGIGLALAKTIADLHGGSLTAASEGEGKGSVFTFRVACAADDSAAPLAAEDPPREVPMPRRILVVDDNVDAALTLAELLALEGHETHVAHDGPSAVDAARRLSPDVAILDIGLPGFDGHEVARRLRAEPALKGVLLVALSGWVQPDDRTRSREAGFDHHLAKPVEFKNLERVLLEAPGGLEASGRRDRTA
ncbi:MAG: response regulator [Acidobacteriota bacterium]|nr:response regulator [Acidobacteriota bacterium]